MKTASIALALPALASASSCKPYVTTEDLQELVTLDDLLAGSQKLQDFADANGGNRAFGGGGHNATVDWLYDTLEATGYYDVVKQPFTEYFHTASATLDVNGAVDSVSTMTYTPPGTANRPVVAVSNVGCDAADYPAGVSGNIALISRGTCSFGQKALNAKAAGAVAAIIYNNAPGVISATLGTPLLDYAPTVGVSQEDGLAILAATQQGEVTADLVIDAISENRVNYNVIAETKGGDHDNVLVLGGHSDSVYAGPGVNDDGSGTVGVLVVAQALTKFRVKNAVRFAFWGAEEFGKLGSYYYVKQLNHSDTEIAKMRAYLNFDMIASPNYVYGIYDGDGNAFNLTGPPGSGAIEKEFEDFYELNGAAHVPSEFSGRSDYAAFIENGIPSGGLFTGAEVLKTEAEAALFGGEAGVAYDINYHKIGDDINNLNHEAYLLNSKSIANSVAKYAISWDSLAPVNMAERRWNADRAQHFARTGTHSHVHTGPCGGGDSI
ncbi:aminopeptidase Y [Paramyrothecium foliicola]|nr:aminopeptidase Y [Paramyrothecium foliicola]